LYRCSNCKDDFGGGQSRCDNGKDRSNNGQSRFDNGKNRFLSASGRGLSELLDISTCKYFIFSEIFVVILCFSKYQQIWLKLIKNYFWWIETCL